MVFFIKIYFFLKKTFAHTIIICIYAKKVVPLHRKRE